MGRIRIKPQDKLFKQTQQMRKLAAQVQSPQQLALMIHQIGNPIVRQKVLDRIRPFLKFKLEGNL